MKKIIYLSLMVAVSFLMISCSAETPQKAAVKYSEYLKNGQFDKFVDGIAFDEKMTPEQVKEQKEQLTALLKEKGTKEFDKKGGLKDVEFVSEEITEDGNRAKVVLKHIYGNGETDEDKMDLVKKDGKWMISMNK